MKKELFYDYFILSKEKINDNLMKNRQNYQKNIKNRQKMTKNDKK
jgi:hypothetical protein